jgi:hypothetical protein
MKPLLKILLLVVLVTGLSSMTVHKFYVSVHQMDYVPQKKVLQMASRIFIDDIEATLDSKYSRKFNIGSKKELPEANEYLQKYIAEKMHVKVNGAEKALKFLGKEVEDDILVCYYTLPAKGKIKSIEVKSTLLFEAYPEQQNIIHTNINSNKKSLLLTNSKPTGVLEF